MPTGAAYINACKSCDYQYPLLTSHRHQWFEFRGDERLKVLGCNVDIRNRIIALVTSILAHNTINAEVDAESRLVDVGLNSVDMVNLMLSLEAEFDFTIPQAEITPENFQSVSTLEQMVITQLQKGSI